MEVSHMKFLFVLTITLFASNIFATSSVWTGEYIPQSVKIIPGFQSGVGHTEKDPWMVVVLNGVTYQHPLNSDKAQAYYEQLKSAVTLNKKISIYYDTQFRLIINQCIDYDFNGICVAAQWNPAAYVILGITVRN
jgi:hypothetical protein